MVTEILQVTLDGYIITLIRATLQNRITRMVQYPLQCQIIQWTKWTFEAILLTKCSLFLREIIFARYSGLRESNLLWDKTKQRWTKWYCKPSINDNLVVEILQATLDGYSSDAIIAMWHNQFAKMVWSPLQCQKAQLIEVGIWINRIDSNTHFY